MDGKKWVRTVTGDYVNLDHVARLEVIHRREENETYRLWMPGGRESYVMASFEYRTLRVECDDGLIVPAASGHEAIVVERLDDGHELRRCPVVAWRIHEQGVSDSGVLMTSVEPIPAIQSGDTVYLVLPDGQLENFNETTTEADLRKRYPEPSK